MKMIMPAGTTSSAAQKGNTPDHMAKVTAETYTAGSTGAAGAGLRFNELRSHRQTASPRRPDSLPYMTGRKARGSG